MAHTPFLDVPSDKASSPVASASFVSRVWDTLRSLVTPTNLAAGGLLMVGWLALLGWTGSGPEGWQARQCAGLDHRPAACGELRYKKDTSRLVPHTASVGSSS